MVSQPTEGDALSTDLEVDLVVRYRFDTPGAAEAEAEAQFEKLVRRLDAVGLSVEARDGDNFSILLFVKLTSEEALFDAVYCSRVKDWLHGVCQSAPERVSRESLSSMPLTEAERLRIVHLLITNPCNEGGAGITPEEGEWQSVDAIFPLHDHNFNKKWLIHWSTRYSLTIDELTKIRDHFGEKIAFYFAFLQSYFTFLLFPAAVGGSAYLLFPSYSIVFAFINCLWSVTFVEYWTRQELNLAVRWGVHGVSSIQHARSEFKAEKEVTNPVTGETLKTFPAYKRLGRQALQIPFALVASVALGSLITICFGIEIFISEVYDGPFKSLLVYLPTILLAALESPLTNILTRFATNLTNYENYQTNDDYEAAMVQKIFVFNLITSYLPIFLTAFVYIPFGSHIAPYINVFTLGVQLFADDANKANRRKTTFHTDPARLRREVVYFGVTAQIVDLAFEVVIPYLKHEFFRIMKDVQSERAVKHGGGISEVGVNDSPEEAAFLKRVRNEADLDKYDVNYDLREMCMQFGYLTTFSVVWPLIPLCFLINNWVELRSDAIKICFEMRRPTPWRGDSIGPWLDHLGFLTWLGSVTSGALVFLFSDNELRPEGKSWGINTWGLLLSIIFSEHIYFVVRSFVRYGVSTLESSGLQQERREQFLVRKHYLNEVLQTAGIAERSNVQSATNVMHHKSSMEEIGIAAQGLRVENGLEEKRREWQGSVTAGVGIMRRRIPERKKTL